MMFTALDRVNQRKPIVNYVSMRISELWILWFFRSCAVLIPSMRNTQLILMMRISVELTR